MNQHYEALVFRIKPGMSRHEVEAILRSRRNKTETTDMGRLNPAMAGQTLDTLTWRDKTNSKNFIILAFVDGRLKEGGTPGYDIGKGFKVKLP